MTQKAFYIPPVNDDARAFAAEVKRQGLRLIGEDEEWPDCPVFFYGSIEGMKHFQQLARWPNLSHAWADTDWCDWRALACTSYYARWGGLMLTQHYGFFPLAELLRLQSRLWRRYADDNGYCYVRPNYNDKVFGGGLFLKDFLGPWLLQAAPNSLRDDLLTLIGTPTQLRDEYRVWVGNGEVITSSQYIRDDKIEYSRGVGCPAGVKAVAEEAARIWSPHPMFVLDIGITSATDEVGIIECGSVHTCGLYDCDAEKIVSYIANS